MARWSQRLEENAAGDLFVDGSCIDCDLCRQIAPGVYSYSERHGQSVVTRQPAKEERHRALMALVACPTASIGSRGGADCSAAVRAFPEPLGDDIYFCGFASADSYGASSYLIVRPEGNVLVDSPRAARPLLRAIDALGGVRWMFLTHRDDVADHERFRAHFGCDRILHRADRSRGTAGVERFVESDASFHLAPDLEVIPVPGHTAGSMALCYARRVLFSGDHLWWSDRRGGLHASRSVCWHSWAQQKRSLRRLEDLDFEWLLPGHGRPLRAPSAAAMRAALRELLAQL